MNSVQLSFTKEAGHILKTYLIVYEHESVSYEEWDKELV